MGNIQKVKQYIEIANPNKVFWVFHLLTFILRYLLALYSAVPSANAITAITIGDLNATIKWLIICCVVVVLQQMLEFILDRMYYKTISNTWKTVYGKIYDKISTASNASFADTSKEKIINIAYNNMMTLGEFPHNFAKYISYFIQAIVTIIILLGYNLIIGATIALVCVLLYFVLNYLNKRLGYWTDKHYDEQDKSLETLADSYHNHQLTRDLNLTDNLRKKYTSLVSKSQDYKYKYGMVASVVDNWVPFAYKAIICALSIYMVVLTKSNVFTLTLYLILTKYLTQAITQMTSSYAILTVINDVHVANLRVKTILDMKPEDLIDFGNNTSDDINGNIVFTNVSYLSKDDDTANIEKFNLNIEKGNSTLIYGSHKCGKHSIFNMINRSIKPSTGTITVDNINIYDFDKETYKHNISTITSKEYFYNDSIMNNMMLSGANKQQIYKVCKEFDLHKKIVGSKNSYNTNLTKEPNILSTFEKYLLALARAVCTNSEIIVMYEIPVGLTTEQKNQLENILKSVAKNHTLIIFAYNDWPKNICKRIYKVEKNKISKQK